MSFCLSSLRKKGEGLLSIEGCFLGSKEAASQTFHQDHSHKAQPFQNCFPLVAYFSFGSPLEGGGDSRDEYSMGRMLESEGHTESKTESIQKRKHLHRKDSLGHLQRKKNDVEQLLKRK